MSDPSTYTPRQWACQNAACSELNVAKDAYMEMLGDVICGTCGTVCLDVGPVPGWPPVTMRALQYRDPRGVADDCE